MKILHTSDWHIGRTLYGRKRYEEFEAFLTWLAETIQQHEIDVLLVAGDVFDTSTPSNHAQELYYRFLCRVAASNCRHVVVVAGNHDSPSFLNAPKELLRALNVYVVGSITDTLNDEVIVLKKKPQISQMDAEHVEALICAVPYLRDRDVRTVEPGETIDDKSRKLVEGIKNHYAEVFKIAEQKKENLRKSAQSAVKEIPIVAMGHLFTAGGKTVDGDGVRELYVGSLAHVTAGIFPDGFDYLALGHLHVPQQVDTCETMRYSGSPIPMGFGEAAQEKSVVIIEFTLQTMPNKLSADYTDEHGLKEISICDNPRNLRINISVEKVPCFQQLVRIVGSLDDIHARIEELKKEDSRAWLEIDYTGSEIIGSLREMLDEALTGSTMEIRRIKNRRVMERVIRAMSEDESLDDLDTSDVFTRCLETFDVPDEDRAELTASYNEIVKGVREGDHNAE